MLITLLAAVAAAVVARLRGGSFENLAATRFRGVWVVVAAVVVQTGFDIWSPEWLSATGRTLVVVASSGATAWFLAINAKLPGMALASIGLLMNVAVIALNGAMPVSRDAARVAGTELTNFGIKHEPLTSETKLPWLADVIPLPGTGQIISPGDVVLAAAIAGFVYARTMRGPHATRVARL